MDRCRPRPTTAGLLLVLVIAWVATPPADAADYVADGRMPRVDLEQRYDTLAIEHGWTSDTIFRYPGEQGSAIRAWRTTHEGPALWVIAGLHGEEPAGPNAIAQEIAALTRLADSGVPIVLVPLANPEAYRRNWRYPNTADRDWRKGGYSIGDAEWLLPDLDEGTRARSARPPGAETEAFTRYVLETARQFPPRLVVDLHEDELSTEGGYVYSQGLRPDDNPAVADVVRVLRNAGIPIRREGHTRFGEPIVDGVISRDDRGGPIRDGSIDELLAASSVFVDGRHVPGPSAPTVIVVETPAYAGSKFDLRVDAHAAVVRALDALWRLGETSAGETVR